MLLMASLKARDYTSIGVNSLPCIILHLILRIRVEKSIEKQSHFKAHFFKS